MRGHAGNHVSDLLRQFFFAYEPIDQTEFAGTFGRHGFASEDEFKRLLGAENVREHGCGKRRKNAKANFRLRKTCLWRRDDEIAERRKLGTAAESCAVDDDEHRF